MYIRRAFAHFLKVQSEVAPMLLPNADWTLDWRWFCEPAIAATLPSERSLIDWPTWAKPKKPSRASSGRR